MKGKLPGVQSAKRIHMYMHVVVAVVVVTVVVGQKAAADKKCSLKIRRYFLFVVAQLIKETVVLAKPQSTKGSKRITKKKRKN